MIVTAEIATDPAVVGGKGAALSRLARDGFAPPAFFVILPEAFSDGEPVPGLSDALAKALEPLGDGPYAVRSSGQSEDGSEHSHAGQFDTVLNVEAAGVIDAARQVWQSGFSDRVATYTELKSGGEVTPPAIVVQRMVASRVSGVAFSADPVSGLRGRVVISAIEGLGDALVSGEEDGQSWVLDGEAVVTAPDEAPILTTEEVQEVAQLARKAEAQFGAPQDIEWAIDGDGLHILQARPITTPLLEKPNPDGTLTIFDNSNIVESYPGMVSPLTYSFAVHVYSRVYRAFVRLLGVREGVIAENGAVFDNMLGRRDGRVYYNLVNWYRALALLPGFALNRSYMETMMGVAEPMPAEVVDNIGPPPAKGLAKLREYARLVRVGFGLLVSAIRLPATRRGFYARLNAALDSGLDLQAAGPTALANEYRRIESELLDRWDAPLVNDFLCMMAFGASRNMLEKWLGPDGLTLHNDVMIGQGDIVSAEPAQRILKMGALAREAGLNLSSGGLKAIRGHAPLSAEFDGYLAKFSDRCTEELKLESIPLADDPAPLIFAIAASAERPVTHTEPPEPDWDELFEGRPIRKRLARWVIGWTKARVRDRENLRFERTRVFGYARQVFLALGREFAARGAIEDARDVFFLTKDEVLGAVEGFALSPDLKGLVALRKADDTASAARPDPEERIDLRGPAALVAAEARASADEETGAERTGTGCSAGKVTAKARVVRDPKTEALEPGDILVARHTDPGWIAVFSNASAIVVERGSLLSHSAIVARELGIPCVVGLKHATQWIEDGERIEVDGSSGKVVRLDAKL
ncbi:MAG: PEP/pyruvate-binding domain-containing protein [Paracoccaceae bacterium]|nr:PEP/pyruvate-binding domain-containing protein [Paracoccaceae bacterium]